MLFKLLLFGYGLEIYSYKKQIKKTWKFDIQGYSGYDKVTKEMVDTPFLRIDFWDIKITAEIKLKGFY